MRSEQKSRIAAGIEMLQKAEEAYQAEKRNEGYYELVKVLIGLNKAIDQFWNEHRVGELIEWQKKSQELLEKLGEI